jgi:hypothetical protein
MSILSTLTKIVDFWTSKQPNLQSKQPRLIIERQIGEDITIGLSNYSAKQALLFENKYYYLTNFTKSTNPDKFKYFWKTEDDLNDTVILELEKLQTPPYIIIYKLYDPKQIIKEGIFNPKYFKTIGLLESKDIDELFTFTSTL